MSRAGDRDRLTSNATSTMRRARRLLGNAEGGAAVETAILIWPLLMMMLGIIQFTFLHYNQDTLSDALFAIASQPSLPGGDAQATYKTAVCNKNAFTANCTTNLKIERYTLTATPTAQTDIAGTAWMGASGDIVVLRASLDTLKVIGFVPTLTAKESVIYKLP